MALIILKDNNTFTVEGKINAATASNFRTHFNLVLNSLKGLTIDISKVTEIDTNGLDAFKVIYNNAKSWNKPFSIVGLGSRTITKDFF